MQTAANNNLVLIDSFSSRRFAEFQNQAGYGKLYQQIVSGLIKDTYSKQFFTELSHRLADLADYLYGLRRMDDVEQVSRLFLTLPLADECRIIGRHYGALCLLQKGRLAEARAVLEEVAEQGPPKFRARALLCISGMPSENEDFQFITKYCVEAYRLALNNGLRDHRTIIESQRNLVVIKSRSGDHLGALADLERMLPFVRSISRWHPDLFCTYLNSFAVELGEVGRFEEALRVSRIALSSPYARIYREVQETLGEIALKLRRASRSAVVVKRKVYSAENVLPMPEPYRISAASMIPVRAQRQEQARVLDLQAWKHKLTKEANAVVREEKPGKPISDREMLLRLMDLISEKDLTKDQLARMLEAIEKIAYEPKGEIN